MEKKELTAADFAKVKWVQSTDGNVGELEIINRRNPSKAFVALFQAKYSDIDHPEARLPGWRAFKTNDEIKPILRRLEDMTEEEKAFYGSTFKQIEIGGGWVPNGLCIRTETAHTFDYLDSIGIDCRGWIDAGLAIDAATLGDRNPYKG